MVATRTSLGRPQKPGCTFCPVNGKVEVLRTSPSGNTVFAQVIVKEGDDFVPAPGAYFVLPTGHYKADEDMPFDFLHEVNWHKHESGLIFDNGGFNYTEPGGAKILDHAHYWMTQVQPGDPPLGLYTLRGEYRKVTLLLRQARKTLKKLRRRLNS